MAFITGLVSTRSMVVMALEKAGKDLKVCERDGEKLGSVEGLSREREGAERQGRQDESKRRTNPQNIGHERSSTRTKLEKSDFRRTSVCLPTSEEVDRKEL